MRAAAAAVVCVLAALCVASAVLSASADGLPSFHIDPKRVTVSGISAGGFMAVQLQVAFSQLFNGVGVIAGGPYYCAEAQEMRALTTCMSYPLLLDVDELVSDTKTFASSGKIDSVDNLKGVPAWVYSGTLDTVVNPKVVKDLETYFSDLGLNVASEYSIPSQHCHPTNDYGNSCSNLGSPFINNCDYSAVANIFGHLLGNVSSPTAAVDDNLKEFDQSAYGASSLGSDGYYYAASSCQNGTTCGIHVALHGCEMSYEEIGQAYVSKADYNQYAESNDLVVLYPQCKKELINNPNACFDWWGYSGADYAFKDGEQMAAISKMVHDLMGQ